ncbi:unnamed protein product [Cylindrotheca closterium]|uniref:Uncharacterized protein n=1 Tax=Cylindrotheca closterium TaxID=2856 RepID=A0AAD2JMW1_9STRA|nr:unnamed protein product [Cylindrotheca closterium]
MRQQKRLKSKHPCAGNGDRAQDTHNRNDADKISLDSLPPGVLNQYVLDKDDEWSYNNGDDGNNGDANGNEPSMSEQPNEETTESSTRTDQPGHKTTCLDINLFKLPCLQDANLESPKTPFDVLAGSLIALNKSLLPRHWFQLFHREMEESKVHESIGTFHEILGLDQNKCLDVLVASGLVAPNKNGKMQTKKKIFRMLKILADGFDFKINTTIQGSTHSFVLIGPPEAKLPSLSEQLGIEKEIPSFDLSNIAIIRDSFKQYYDSDEIPKRHATSTAPEEDAENHLSETDQTKPRGILYNSPSLGKKKKNKNNRRMRTTLLIDGERVPCPNNYKLVSKQKLNHYKRTEKLYEAIRKASKRKICVLDEQMKFFLGAVVGLCVQVPGVAFEQIFFLAAIIFATILKLVDFKDQEASTMSHLQILKMMPSQTTGNRYAQRAAAHNVIRQGARMMQAKALFLGADKGGSSLIKKICYFSEEDGIIDTIDLDFDGSGEDTVACADAVYHSMSRYVFGDDKHIQLNNIIKGGGSDSGGGFINAKMKEQLVRVCLASNTEYIHCPCTSHNDQTNLRTAIENIFGQGGLERRNDMQLLHAYAYFQREFSDKDEYFDLLKASYHGKFPDKKAVPKDLLRLMQEPILTSAICNVEKTDSKKNKCGRNFLSLAKEPVIKGDLAFLFDFDQELF